MIGYLKGTVLHSSPDRVLLDVHGVGYDVSIPLTTFYELERVGHTGTVGLHIHTHVREDAIELFGFWNEKDKQLFEKLLLVSGVGPRLARVILSGMQPELLLSALASGDTVRLATIPGIGKKTAERLVVELQDRVQSLAADLERPIPRDEVETDLVEALVNLGYKQAHALRAVGAARQENPDAPFHELLRLSLQQLSRV